MAATVLLLSGDSTPSVKMVSAENADKTNPGFGRVPTPFKPKDFEAEIEVDEGDQAEVPVATTNAAVRNSWKLRLMVVVNSVTSSKLTLTF